MSAECYIGQRLSYETHLCTVRYIGPVQGTKGEWLGVEWDDPTRGKHDGQHANVQYFKCVSSFPTPASFVRPSRPHDPRRTFVEALNAKYVSEDIVDAGLKSSANGDVINISGKDVEEIGFDKIRQQLADLWALKIVVLDGLRIGKLRHEAADGDAFAGGVDITSPNIVDLDLSRNLFDSWREITSIILQLPNLASLNASGNRLSNCDNDIDALKSRAPFSTLRSLGLDNCLLRWEKLSDIPCSFPSLRSLSISNNELRGIHVAALPTQLTHLTLEGNMFEYLSQLRSLTTLKNLHRLSLKGNSVRAVHESGVHGGCKRQELVFPESLEDVDLSYNDISSWQFVDELANVFPGMICLRTTSNPLYMVEKDVKNTKEITDAGFILTIARLGRLDTLNFSKVTSKVRHDAEAYYLSQICKELSSSPEENAAGILSRHARFKELCGKFGEPVVVRAQSSAANPNTLAAHLIHCTFEIGSTVASFGEDKSLLAETGSWETDIPDSFTVYNVIGVVGAHFGLPPTLLKLVWETGEEEAMLEHDIGIDAPEYARNEPKRAREEILQPRTRRIGTWLESGQAKIRVEVSEDDIKHRQAARLLLSS